MADTEIPAAVNTEGNRKFEEVTLLEPIERGDSKIEKLQLRKPQAGQLRGLALNDIVTSNISTLMVLIPRISSPVLAAHEVEALDPADLMEIGGVIRGFFMTAGERKMLEAMMAEQTSRA